MLLKRTILATLTVFILLNGCSQIDNESDLSGLNFDLSHDTVLGLKDNSTLTMTVVEVDPMRLRDAWDVNLELYVKVFLCVPPATYFHCQNVELTKGYHKYTDKGSQWDLPKTIEVKERSAVFEVWEKYPTKDVIHTFQTTTAQLNKAYERVPRRATKDYQLGIQVLEDDLFRDDKVIWVATDLKEIENGSIIWFRDASSGAFIKIKFELN